jgi:hypothetical protein
MEINFNSLRKKLIRDYNEVLQALNGAICEDIDMDRVIIPVGDISLKLERLRHDIITIGAINDPSLKDCSCVVDKDTEILEFLPNT